MEQPAFASIHAMIPTSIRTEQMLLRRWRADDAALLVPVLEANVTHLTGWIPRHVSEPAPVAEMARRLAGFADDFDAGRGWRYGLFLPDESTVLGEVSLFPRDSAKRVLLEQADRLEIGYWLRADYTGRGLATEASRAMLDLAMALPGMRCVEIRCNAANVRSAAVPRRLGFRLTESSETVSNAGRPSLESNQVWEYVLAP